MNTGVEKQKQGLLAAHSVALHVQVVAPIPPSTISVECHAFAPDKPSVDVNFYQNADGVKQLAAALGAEVAEGPHTSTRPDLYTVATAEVAGIPVRIWSLTSALETGGAL